jgi:hypothetical protein
MKTTIATYNAGDHHGPTITYEEIDTSLVKPVRRDYTSKAATQRPAQ